MNWNFIYTFYHTIYFFCEFSFIMRANEKDLLLKTKLNSWSLKSWTVYDLLTPLNSKKLKTKINILVMLL